jgi:heme exporter protein D
MNWGSAPEFFAMGGYAWYVWGSYAVTAVVLSAEVFVLRRRRRTIVEQLRRLRWGDAGSREVKS